MHFQHVVGNREGELKNKEVLCGFLGSSFGTFRARTFSMTEI